MANGSWLGYFLKYYARRRLGGRRAPILAGFKITHRCNLRCLHCPFWKMPEKMLGFDRVSEVLHSLHAMGVRILILEGGEPFLWRDGDCTIHDVVALGRQLFYSVGVTTNGTFPIDVDANAVWVSIDGLRETHNRIRGDTFDQVMRNIEGSRHPNILANVTINRLNHREVPELVRSLRGKVKGITIQFHYPYEDPDTDALALPFPERGRVLDDIIQLKKVGYPVSDCYAVLRALKDNRWKCHDWMLASAEPDGSINTGCYVKGRGTVNCEWCGFAAHAELSKAFDGGFGSIMVGLRTFRYGDRRGVREARAVPARPVG